LELLEKLLHDSNRILKKNSDQSIGQEKLGEKNKKFGNFEFNIDFF